MDAKRGLMAEQPDPSTQRRVKAELYADQVKVRTVLSARSRHDLISAIQRNQVRGELTVERIVRQRSLDGKPSVCLVSLGLLHHGFVSVRR
jgi:hypothetical protein